MIPFDATAHPLHNAWLKAKWAETHYRGFSRARKRFSPSVFKANPSFEPQANVVGNRLRIDCSRLVSETPDLPER